MASYHDQVKHWEVWCEGYRASGDCSEALYFGMWPGKTFRDAVQAMVDKGMVSDLHLIDIGKLTYWGCRFFDNEADARREFG